MDHSLCKQRKKAAFFFFFFCRGIYCGCQIYMYREDAEGVVSRQEK